MKLADFPQVETLSVSEKVLLVEELWNSIGDQSDKLDPPAWHDQALAEDAAEYAENSEVGSSWSDSKRRITNSARDGM